MTKKKEVRAIGIRELRAAITPYLEAAQENGEEFFIMRHDKPVALITPIPKGTTLEEIVEKKKKQHMQAMHQKESKKEQPKKAQPRKWFFGR